MSRGLGHVEAAMLAGLARQPAGEWTAPPAGRTITGVEGAVSVPRALASLARKGLVETQVMTCMDGKRRLSARLTTAGLREWKRIRDAAEGC